MNYIGSKFSLLSFLEESIYKVVDKDCATFCDLFAGTGIVGRHFKQKGLRVFANDLQYYSYVLNKHYIGNSRILKFEKLLTTIPELQDINVEERKYFVCQYLSDIEPIEGFVYRNYCAGGTKGGLYERLYFSDENGMLCDAIRSKIEEWFQSYLISDSEFYFLLTSLIESIDKLANTASVYGAFLKKMKRSASNKLVVQAAEHDLDNQEHEVFCGDSNKIISTIQTDILYLDPPYNRRQYAPNYHLLETISRYDSPILKGKTGLRGYRHQKSDYSTKSKVKKAFTELMLAANARYVFLSYNNEGLLSLDDIKSIMSLRGKYGVFTKKYSRFKADKTESRKHTADSTTEYLHYVVVQD
jgi:adenine-specific DNA-methyltransferase